MDMFPNYMAKVPKNRSEMVNELEIPEVTVSPYIWTPPEELLSLRSDSLLTDSLDDVGTTSTDSSMPLSRAMTDSDIDYERYKRFKNRRFSNPWDELKAAYEAFPPDHLTSLTRFRYSLPDKIEESLTPEPVRRYNEELRLKMERFFKEECCVFTPDDPGLLALEDALESLDLKSIDSELDSLGREI